LIPLARIYCLDSLHESVKDVNRIQSQPVMIEYLMLADRNDSLNDAKLLVEWVSDLRVHVNLIPFNPIVEAPHLTGSDRATCLAFAEILKQSGIKTTIRRSLGQDVSAACGQLVQHENRQLAVTKSE